MRRILFLAPCIFFFFVSSCQTSLQEPRAKYVFLFIGDGMGMNQVYSTELYLAALDNKSGNGSLSFSHFPVQSYVTTYSANSLITCSSAAATALASGYKTNNGFLNMDTSLTFKFETVAEKAKKLGFKVGILSSVPIDHATPAGFYAHNSSRNAYREIGFEMPESNFDYFGGGAFSTPKGNYDSLPASVENAKAKGYNYINTVDGFNALKKGDEKVFAVNPFRYACGEFYWEIDKVKGSVSLADFTKKGIELIDNPKGFFMMVEGGKIDWACHGNDMASCIHEVLAFDAAVKEAIVFYNAHPNETLILVTADHETGGLGLGINNSLKMGLMQYQNISAQEFGRKIVQFKKDNPNATFTQVMALIEMHFGLGDDHKGLELTESEKNYLYEGYELEFIKKESESPDDEYLEHSAELLITERVIHLMSQKAGAGWLSTNHSGTPVPIRAIGPGQEYFSSYMDNTEVSKIISKVMGLGN